MIYPEYIYLENNKDGMFYVIKLVGDIFIEKNNLHHKIMSNVNIIKTNDKLILNNSEVDVNLDLNMFDKRTKDSKYYNYKVLTEAEALAYAV